MWTKLRYYLTKKLRLGDQLLGKHKVEQNELVNQIRARLSEGEHAIRKVRHSLTACQSGGQGILELSNFRAHLELYIYRIFCFV